MDVTKMAESVFVTVKEYISKSLAPIMDRLKALEDRPLPEAIKGDSVTVAEVVSAILPALQEQLKAMIDALPGPKDGRTPTSEEIALALELPIARALLDFERRAQGILQKAIDAIPKPKDGLDGLGFDEMSIDHDGEREVVLRFSRGDHIKEFPLSLPLVIDRGFWKDGTEARKGDGMTFGGSYWIAQTETKSKPEVGNPDWRLAVRKGRDGKSQS